MLHVGVCLFFVAFWSPAGKGLTSWLSCVVFCHFPKCVLVHIRIKGEVPGGYFFCGSFMFFFVLCLLCLCARLFICALWPPAGLTSWLSSVVSNCEMVTFPLLSWVLIVSIPYLCTLTYF